MFHHRFTRKEGHRVLAACDEELLGEVLEDRKLTFEVKERFYGGEKIDKEGLLEKANESTIINAVGNKTVSFFVKKNFFDEDQVLEIDGVKHAQMVRI
ncbi:MAG: DUF424 domain-containing protein [Candidatus Aenigmatarchaeota archaeon]